MKNACPLACFIRNTHRDSVHISAEKPHRNINYARNLGGGVGRAGAEREYGIRGVVLMRGSLSPAGLGGHAAGVDSKTHFGLSVMEMLSGTAEEL